MKKVTIYDVAREAGVSLATVSRVINGSSVVREKTKQKVLKVINDLDFKPNQVARGLATSKTTTIAIIFPQSLVAHVKNMIGGIGDAGRHLDYNITIYTTDDIYALPDGERAELINGQIYYIAPPSRTHQRIVGKLYTLISNYIDSKNGPCEVDISAFAVLLNEDNKNYI